jgi:hypothetical protein
MKERWLYLGQAHGANYPVIERFIKLDAYNKEIGESFAFKKFRIAMLPGGIYNVEVIDEGTVNPRNVIFSGKMLGNQERLAEIQTDHQLFKSEKRLKSLESKFKTEFKLSNDLGVLAIEYSKLYGTDKLIFEWLVLTKLRELAGRA